MIAEVDNTHYPIVIFKMLPIEISDQNLENYLALIEKSLLESNQKLIIIYNNQDSRFLSGDQLVRISKWGSSKTALFQANTIGTCVVTSSILSNLILKSLKVLLKSNFNASVFSSMELALEWSKEQLMINKKTCLN